MKRYLILFSFFLNSFAVAQTSTSSDNFDTAAVNDIAGNRRKWGVVSNFPNAHIQTNGDGTIALTGTTNNAGAAIWDSTITGSSYMELSVAAVGPTTNGPSFYYYWQIPNATFSQWTGYRIKWLRAGTDYIVLDRVTGGNASFTGLDTISRVLQANDRIRVYEFGDGWHSVTVIRSSSTIDSMAAFDNTTLRSSWKWGIRGFYYSTGVMSLDNMDMGTLTAVPPKDSIPPAIVSFVQSPASPDSAHSFRLNLRATDDYGLDSLYIRFGNFETGIMGDSLHIKCGTTMDTTLFITIPKKPVGVYIVQARVRDDTGHVVTSGIIQFTVVPPLLTPYRLYDNFDTSTTANVSAIRRKYIALTGQTDASATMQINGDSTLSPRNLQGNGFAGAIAIDSLRSGRAVTGFRIIEKGTVDNSFYIYMRMSNKDLTTGNGYRLKILNQPPGTGTGIDQFEIDNVTGSTITNLIVKEIEFQNGDTIYFKTYTGTNLLVGVVRGTRSGIPFADSISAIGNTYVPSTWYTWLRGFVFSTASKIDDLYLDTLAGPPPLPVTTRDTIPPIIVNKGISSTNLDTSTVFNVFFEARDETTNVSYSSIPSKGLDSMWLGIYSSPVDTLVEQIGKKISNAATSFDTILTSLTKKRVAGGYKVRFWVRDDSLNVTRDSLTFSVTAARRMFVTTYYPTWMFRPFGSGGYYSFYGIPPQDTKFQGLTHVLIFGDVNIDVQYPYFALIGGSRGSGGGGPIGDSLKYTWGTATTGVNYRDSLVKYVHLGGAKVLTCIQQAQSGTALLYVLGTLVGTDSARTDTLCIGVAKYIERNKFDGVDINWESNLPTVAQSSFLLRRLRTALNNITTGSGGRAVITITPPVGDASGSSHYDPATVNANVDQVNPQHYANDVCWYPAVGSNANWFLNPLYDGTYPSGFEAHSYESRGAKQWITAGFDPKIMGLGIGAFARSYRPNNQIFQAWSVRTDDIGLDAAVQLRTQWGGVEGYDSARHAHYISGIAPVNIDYHKLQLTAGERYWFSYQDARDIADQVNWAKTNNLGGIMLYSMASDGEPSRSFDTRFLIHNQVIAAVGNSTILPPNTPIANTPSGDINNQPITNLLLSWQVPTGATTYRFQLNTDSTFVAATNIIDEPALIVASITVGSSPYSTLIYDRRYYWRVNAGNVTGTSAFTPVQTFKTRLDPLLATNPPAIPVLIVPTNNATGQTTTLALTVNKSAVGDTVASFNIVLSTDTNFTSIIVNDSNVVVTSPTRIVTGLSQGTVYYWRARARNNAGYSAFTSRFKFTTGTSTAITAFKTGQELVFDAQQRIFSLAVPTRRLIRDNDPTFWILPDSGEIAWYGRGFMLRDGRKFDLSVLTGSPTITYQQIITELGKTNPTWTTYHTFANGMSIGYGGTSLATFDAAGTYFTGLNVTGASRFSGGLSTFTAGMATDSINAITPSFGMILGTNQLYFYGGGPRGLSIVNALSGIGQTLTIIGQKGALNTRGGDLALRGGIGNNSGAGGDVILQGGDDGGLGIGGPGTVRILNKFQFQNGSQGAGKYVVSDANGNLTFIQTIISDSTKTDRTIGSRYFFEENWDMVGTSTFAISSSTTNSFGHHWGFLPFGGSGTGMVISVHTPVVADSARAPLADWTKGGTTTTMGQEYGLWAVPNGWDGTIRNSLLLRKTGMWLRCNIQTPATLPDSVVFHTGFINGTGGAMNPAANNREGIYIEWSNKPAPGSFDTVRAVVSKGDGGKTKVALVYPVASKAYSFYIDVQATQVVFWANNTSVSIPTSDANMPANTVMGVPIINWGGYGNAVTNQVLTTWGFSYSYPRP